MNQILQIPGWITSPVKKIMFLKSDLKNYFLALIFSLIRAALPRKSRM